MAVKYCIPVIRLLAFAFLIAAAIIMSNSNDRATVQSNVYYVNYKYWGSFRFFMVANSIACGYNFLVMFMPAGSPLWRLIILLDWAMSTFLTTSFAVAVNSYEEINVGVMEAGWVPQCGIVPGFCSNIVLALVTGGIGLFICVSVIACSLKILANPCLIPDKNEES